jgi:hypothetical protein
VTVALQNKKEEKRISSVSLLNLGQYPFVPGNQNFRSLASELYYLYQWPHFLRLSDRISLVGLSGSEAFGLELNHSTNISGTFWFP